MNSSENTKRVSARSIAEVRRKMQEAVRELRALNSEAEATLMDLARKDLWGKPVGTEDDSVA